MLKNLLFSLFLLTAGILNAQNEETTERVSYVDLGVGVGQNYGITGAKVVLGMNGSGLMVGVGNFDGYTTFSVAAQVRYQWWFANLGYGTIGSYEFTGLFRDKGLLNSVIFLTGGQINLNPNKSFYLELAVGYHGASNEKDPFGEPIDSGGLAVGAGLGYRFGK